MPTTLVPAAAAPTHIHSTACDSAPATAGAAQREVVCRGGRRRLSLSTRVKSWHSSAWMSQPTVQDVWKSQPSLNDFDAGAHMRAKISELSPREICCWFCGNPTAERSRFPARGPKPMSRYYVTMAACSVVLFAAARLDFSGKLLMLPLPLPSVAAGQP
eukprot:SAG25_NODE_91_length_16078_cov_7.663058_8_plen_159_part_00